MEAGDPVLLDGAAWPPQAVDEALRAFYAGTEPEETTPPAPCAAGLGGGSDWLAQSRVPFDSAYKWSAAAFAGHGSFVIGAPEFVAGPRYASWPPRGALACQGLPGAAAGRLPELPDPKAGLDPRSLTFAALVPVSNRIRPEAPRTFRYFAQQGVAIRVISGDNPLAVSEVARQAGVQGAEQYVDASTLRTDEQLAAAAEKYTVFGRVTPGQKRKPDPRHAGRRPHRCHDRRRRQRRAGAEGRRLRHRHGVGRPGRQPGGPAGADGLPTFPACPPWWRRAAGSSTTSSGRRRCFWSKTSSRFCSAWSRCLWPCPTRCCPCS